MPTSITIPYTPRPVQWQLHGLAEQCRFLVAVAHRQSGKTWFAINECLQSVLFSQERAPFALYVAPYRIQAKNNGWETLKYLARSVPGCMFNEAELRCDFPNGGRIQLAGGDNAHGLRGLALNLAVIDEAAFAPPDLWPAVIRPMLAARGGRAIFISTPFGANNHLKRLYDDADGPEWGKALIKASESGVLTEAELASARRTMSEEMYQREFECSWSSVEEGGIYTKLMEQARRENRITHVPHRPGVPVITACDPGRRDLWAWWFIQVIPPGAYHVIDFLQESGGTIEYFAGVLKERARRCGYQYGQHLAPHDAAAENIQTGRSLVDVAAEHGVLFDVVKRGDVSVGINHVRTLLPQCWFDAEKCGEGIVSLERYAFEWDSEARIFSLKPKHDTYSHAADALRTFGVGREAIPDEDDLETYTKDLKTELAFNPFSYEKGHSGLGFSPWRR